MSYRKTAEFEKKFEGKTLSSEQDSIFETLSKGMGNLCISASAGTGKSTAIAGMVANIPSNSKKDILILMHNKSVKEHMISELCSLYGLKDAKELKDKKKIDVYTLHGYGFRIVSGKHKFDPKSLRNAEDFDEKYVKYIRENLNEISNGETFHMTDSKKFDYRQNVYKIVQYAQLNLLQKGEDIEEKVVKYYGINTIANETEAAVKVLEWGCSPEGMKEFNFADLLWIPYVDNINIPSYIHYDYIFIDEAQDLSPAQINLVKKSYRRGTRVIEVGDEYQSINAWCGAKSNAMGEIKNACGGRWTDLKLTVNYRCGRNIINEAQKANINNGLNVSLNACPNAENGAILYAVSLKDIPMGSMILCRVSSKLMEIYLTLLSNGKCAVIRGEKELKRDLKEKAQALNGETAIDMYVSMCREFSDTLFKTCEKYECDDNDAMKIVSVFNEYMRVKTFEIFAKMCKTKEEILKIIDDIGVEDENSGDCIVLSTIHRAKGAEADNVYIACPSFIKSSFGMESGLDWEISSEKNLEYVAKTRAKKVLGYIDEKEIRMTKDMSTNKDSIMRDVEEIKSIANGELVIENLD